MKTNANTRSAGLISMAKNLAVVTVLGFFLGVVFSQTNLAEAALSPARPVNLNAPLAQVIVNQVYEQTRASGETTRRDDMPCAEESRCLAKKFSKALRRYGFATKTVILNKKNAGGIKMRGPNFNDGLSRDSIYDSHIVTMTRLIGGWRVVDPLVLQTATLEPFKLWHKRIVSPAEMSVR